MRRLLLTRGAQGAGKSTALARAGLQDHTLSADAIRRLVASPELTVDGRWSVSQEHDAYVWKTLLAWLEARMERFETVVVDATHRRARDLAPYMALAERHRYAVAVLDFSGVSLERCVAQNQRRVGTPAFVPEEVLRVFHQGCLEGTVPAGVQRIPWDEDDAWLAEVRAFLDVPVRDLSAYDAVLHVGDLQGCVTPLRELLPNGPEPGTFTVFVGDLCDRGIENGEVVRAMLEWTARDDVAVVWGNHEDHLHRVARGLACRSNEFETRTLPQLEAAGLTPEDLDLLCSRMVEVMPYVWRGQHVLVSHAGLPTVPEALGLVSGRQLARGTGAYSEPVDARFDALAPPGWVQVHGHRNVAELPVQASPRSFNLEGRVEFGGHLRAVRLDASGFTPVEVRNRVFRPLTDWLAIDPRFARKPLPPWVREGEALASPAVTPETIDALRAHPLVQERVSTSRPWISSFHFSREAFQDARWDEVTSTARGLFVDAERGDLVARAYDKFFNLGERPETQPEALAERLTFPVTAWLKDNGFLGLLGYCARDDDLFFSSKTSPESTFTDWFRELLHRQVGDRGLERLRRYVRDTASTFVFEVIDPVRDPHVVAYGAPHVVLLDVVRRAMAFERMPYADLVKVGSRYDLPVKRRVALLDDLHGFQRFVAEASAPGWTFQGREVEGLVFEDAKGLQVKLKTDVYSLWKRLRSLKDRLRRGRSVPPDDDPRAEAFLAWARLQPESVLAQDIITLRRAFEAGEPPPPLVVQEDGEVLGFARALEGLAEAVGQGNPLKASTAAALLKRALDRPDLLGLLRGHPVTSALLSACDEGDVREAVASRLAGTTRERGA